MEKPVLLDHTGRLNNMANWGDLTKSLGVLESDAWNISTSYQNLTVVVDSIGDYQLNGGEIRLEYTTSHDSNTWGEWKPFYETNMFEIDALNSEGLYFKIRITFCISENQESPELKKFSFNFKERYKIVNNGDLTCKPKIWITKKNSDGDVKLYNSKNQKPLELKNLKNKEVVFIDCDTEDVITDLPLTYRYDDHNDIFTELLIGKNYLHGEGDFKLDIKYQMRILQE